MFSLSDDLVRPFDERHEDQWTAELGSPLIQIGFRDPTGTGAGSSREDGNVPGDNFGEGFAERRPTDRHDRVRRRLAHEVGGLAR